MVKGMNEELLYGPTAARIMQHDIDSETGSGTEYGSDQGWINYLTCYSYENNTDAQGDKRTNINKANEQELIKSLEITPGQAKWIVNNRKNNYKTIADILTEGQKAGSGGNADANAAEPIYMDTFEKVIDKITIDDRRRQTGKVNINTADRVVLTALLEGDVALADNIIAYRSNLLTGMTSPADLMKVNSMTIERFKKILSMVTTRSGVYSIHGTAKSSTTNCKMKIEVVVDRGRTPPAILYWRQGGVN
jgi:DNA uptake protein ComE-like DNA-binding protein